MESKIEKLSPSLDVELQQLNQRLEMIRSQYIKWTDPPALIEERLNCTQKITHDAMHKTDMLRQEISEYRTLLSDNEKKLSQEAEMENRVRGELKEIALKADAALREREKVAADVKQQAEKNQQQRELLAKQEGATGEIRQGLEKAAKMFRETLGLQLKKLTGGRLQFVFTQIDPKEPNLAFVFTVKIMDRTTYIVSDVQPSVAELPELVTALNESNDFQKFVCKMRRAFKNTLHT